jgi:hypothetical protein
MDGETILVMNKLMAPPASARMHYALILEWLDPDERRTGAELHAFLVSKGFCSQLVVCNSAVDVQAALANAQRDLETLGIPAVHIEAHGANPYKVPISETGFGSRAMPGLSWADLGNWLAPLNAASGFALLVVGATCFGMGMMAAMPVYKHRAPFAGCVGFTTPVRPVSIRDAMRELYRSLLAGSSINEAVDNANRELHNADEHLKLIPATTLALDVLRGAFRLVAQKEADSVVASTEETCYHPEDVRKRRRMQMQEAWDTWFPTGLQERRPDEYRLDWALVEQ